MRFNFRNFLVMLLASLTVLSCSKDSFEPEPSTPSTPSEPETPVISDNIKMATQFAKEMMNTYYLWNEERADAISKQLDFNTCTDPIKGVSNARSTEDRWTALYDNIDEISSSMVGVETTYGYYVLYGKFTNADEYFGVVAYVYKDSPAEKAGLGRGNIILKINGSAITKENLSLLSSSSEIDLGLGVYDSEENGIYEDPYNVQYHLTATTMYEDPILASEVFLVGTKKVAYLAYSSFDLKSGPALVEKMKEFKEKGATELVLDLRYNGGGYVETEEALASMIAPKEAVNGKELYQKNIFNSILTDYYTKNGYSLDSYFRTDFSYKDGDTTNKYSTADANVGFTKVYALVSGSSASASESILIGLMPYMDVVVIGEQTHGKFCTGIVIEATEEEKYNKLKNWGIYVMIGSYADKNGNNPCRPDGIAPDYEVEDIILDAYDLGDSREHMLNYALCLADGKTPSTKASTRALAGFERPVPLTRGPLFGKRIQDSKNMRIRD